MVLGGVTYTSSAITMRYAKWNKQLEMTKESLGCHQYLNEKNGETKVGLSDKTTKQISGFLPILDQVCADPSITCTLQSIVRCMPIPSRAEAVADLALSCAETDVNAITEMWRINDPLKNFACAFSARVAITL